LSEIKAYAEMFELPVSLEEFVHAIRSLDATVMELSQEKQESGND